MTTANPLPLIRIHTDIAAALVQDIADHSHQWGPGVQIGEGLYQHRCICWISRCRLT